MQGNVQSASFGSLPDGVETRLFTMRSSELALTLTTFGARVVSLESRDRHGALADVALGYKDAPTYTTGRNAFFGATIGRVGNRIRHGEFLLDGTLYRVPTNNGVNALHGGPRGFDLRNWEAEELRNGVTFTLNSVDGDQGFPGTLSASVTYELEGNTIRLRYRATTDKHTVANLTNHTYFNLGGEGSASILDHELSLFADRIVAIDETLIPTGELMPVAGTPFDFTLPTRIGARIDEAATQLQRAKGYDHTFVLRGAAGKLHPVARLHHPESGRVLEVSSTEPGVQFYSGNFLDGSLVGKSGKAYGRRCALCLETQHFPDSPNHPEFPSIELFPGQEYASETVWTFAQE